MLGRGRRADLEVGPAGYDFAGPEGGSIGACFHLYRRCPAMLQGLPQEDWRRALSYLERAYDVFRVRDVAGD